MNAIFGKIVRLGRATVFLLGLAVVLAAIFTATSIAFAANGKPFLLRRNNAATAITTLTKQGPGPALRLLARPGSPPMAVNTKGRVNNLNADLVDGKSAEQFSRVAQMQTRTRALLSLDSAAYGSPLSITAPAPGFVRLNGNVTLQSPGCTINCEVEGWIRHVNTENSGIPAEDNMYTNPGNFSSFGSRGNVSLDGIFPVSAGVNTFEIRLARRFSGGNGAIQGWQGTLTAEYTPYDGQGNSP
jgi:hypothetical protein